MTSNPSHSASAAKPTSKANAPRMRICAVVSANWRSTEPSGCQRSARSSATVSTTASNTTPPTSTSCAPTPLDVREKNSDSRITVPKSASDALAITSCPKLLCTWSASFNTATTNAKRGCSKRNPNQQRRCDQPCRSEAVAQQQRNCTCQQKIECGWSEHAAQFIKRNFHARQKEQKRQPNQAQAPGLAHRLRPGQSRLDQWAMPASSSRTAEGRRRRGTNPASSGSANAATTTTSRLANDSVAITSFSNSGVIRSTAKNRTCHRKERRARSGG